MDIDDNLNENKEDFDKVKREKEELEEERTKLEDDKNKLEEEKSLFKLEKEDKGESKDDLEDEESTDLDGMSDSNKESDKKYNKEEIDKIVNDIDISKILREAEMEYYREIPHQFKKYNDKEGNKLTFSEQLSLKDRCGNFKNEISKSNEIKVKPDSIQLLNKCPDEIYEEIIRRGISKLEY